MPRPQRTRAPYKFVAPFVWELAYADYMAGETAGVVAARYDIGLSNLQQTFNRRGWTRKALAEARARIRLGPGASQGAPSPAPAPATGPETGPDRTLFDTVLGRAREALTAGRGSEATALLKAVRDYVAAQQDVAEACDAIAPVERALAESGAAPIPGLTDALLISQLRLYWSPLPPEEAAWREAERDRLKADEDAHRARAATRAAKGGPLSQGERA
ncbi:MAG: hypothetical protein Q8S03_12730 [Brevundimonas sp.]|uniref:hypothetical protein n=1 Tax=Brevundimonas sp. TaxID=1871086 RepID=UPI0027330F70|nr:hypothetical protein [Brevundimonas sp.]MDP3405552.1 hypothetical protein [Brevundimonas sp.]